MGNGDMPNMKDFPGVELSVAEYRDADVAMKSLTRKFRRPLYYSLPLACEIVASDGAKIVDWKDIPMNSDFIVCFENEGILRKMAFSVLCHFIDNLEEWQDYDIIALSLNLGYCVAVTHNGARRCVVVA